MSKERYLITGVQLGMLVALKEEKDRKNLSEEIIDKQFIDTSSKSNVLVDVGYIQKLIEINGRKQ